MPILLIALALICCAPSITKAQIVKAEDYNSFWLWAGVKGRTELEKANTIYLHQGEIRKDYYGNTYLKQQGGSLPAHHKPALWLVYRVSSLDWTPEIITKLNNKYLAWREKTEKVNGIQIDFDASTYGLNKYSIFLRNLRLVLPKECKLSVTGLMDWASQASPADLDALSNSVDEIIFQTYRGKETVQDIDAYLARINRLHISFRLGLSEGAYWLPSTSITTNPFFGGYVVFLRNRE